MSPVHHVKEKKRKNKTIQPTDKKKHPSLTIHLPLTKLDIQI